MRLKVIKKGQLRYGSASEISEHHASTMITVPWYKYRIKCLYSRVDDIP